MEPRKPTTDEFLMEKLPNLLRFKSWLKRLNKRLGWLNSENGGNANMNIIIRNMKPKTVKLEIIDELSPSNGGTIE